MQQTLSSGIGAFPILLFVLNLDLEFDIVQIFTSFKNSAAAVSFGEELMIAVEVVPWKTFKAKGTLLIISWM